MKVKELDALRAQIITSVQALDSERYCNLGARWEAFTNLVLEHRAQEAEAALVHSNASLHLRSLRAQALRDLKVR